MNSKKILSTNLKSLMNKFGISRNKLADDLNIKYTTITSWVTGQKYPRADKINKLCKYFKVSRSRLEDDQEDYTNGHFDIAKAIKNGHYMTWQGKPLTSRDKKMLEFYFGGDDSKHE